MLHSLRHIAVVGLDEFVSPLFGGSLGDELIEKLSGLRGKALASAPVGAGIAVSVPLGSDRWCIWVFAVVPPIMEMSATFDVLKRLTPTLVQEQKKPSEKETVPHPRLKVLLADIASETLPRRRWARASYVAGKLATFFVEDGTAAGMALAELRGGKIKQLWLSDKRFEQARDELRAVLVSALENDGAPEDLDRALVAERFGVAGLSFDLPEAADGYALVTLGPKQSEEMAPGLARELVALVAPIHKPRHLWITRWLALAALVAAIGWLGMPSAIYLTVPGVLLPDDVYGVPLSTDATLQDISVVVGDEVLEGDVIAVLRSVKLEEQKTQSELEVTMEAINAETALAESNYGGFQIAEKRLQIAKTRLQQVEEQIAELTVRVPHNGRVVSALSKSDNGRLLPLGTELARVQRGQGFLVRMTPTKLDANLMGVGTEGVMYVRGVQGGTPQVTLISPPFIPVTAGDEAADLVALGELRSSVDMPLISGMSGYARLKGPETIRVLALTRNLREFFRVKAWYYLGLHW